MEKGLNIKPARAKYLSLYPNLDEGLSFKLSVVAALFETQCENEFQKNFPGQTLTPEAKLNLYKDILQREFL